MSPAESVSLVAVEKRRLATLEETTSGLIGLIYEAAADPGRWPVFLRDLGRVLGSQASTLVVQDGGGRRGSMRVAVGFDPAFRRSYDHYYASRDVYMVHGRRLLREGTVCMNHWLCPDEIAKRSEFFHDWIVPQKLNPHAIFAVVFDDQGQRSILVCAQRNEATPFDRKSLQLVEMLLPHLMRGMQLHARLSHLRMKDKVAYDALNCWALGVIALDSKGRVILANRQAERILQERDGITLDTTGLRGGRPKDTAALRALIYEAVQQTVSGRGAGFRRSGLLSLPRPSLKRPFSVLVTPAPSTLKTVLAEKPCVLLFVSDPETRPHPPSLILSYVYGLTAAESAVALRLLRGASLKEAGEQLGISRNTARFHMKHIFEKTDTHRQAELVRLLVSGPAQLVFPAAGQERVCRTFGLKTDENLPRNQMRKPTHLGGDTGPAFGLGRRKGTWLWRLGISRSIKSPHHF